MKEGILKVWKHIYVAKGLIAIAFVTIFALYMSKNDDAPVSTIVSEKEIPIYCVDTDEKKVALTFDAGWGDEYTEEILKILADNNIKATFFVTGEWVEKYPEDVKKIVEAGHDIGNHSENHRNMSTLTEEENKEEIMSVHNKVKALTGIDMTLFRAPYGDYDEESIKVIKSSGYFPIQWSVDSLDWKNYGSENIISTVLQNKNLESGAIILMHNGAKYTTAALQAIIDGLKNQGYSFAKVSELIYKDGYKIDNTGKQVKE